MHKLYELKEKLMKELEDYADNGKFSKDDVEAIKYAASAIGHIRNIVEDEEGYSGYSMEDERRGGSYARGRGRNARRDSMGRYSREGGYSRAADDMVRELRELMQDAPDDRTRQEFQRFIQKIEQM